KRYNLFTLMLSGALAAVGSATYSLMANGFAYYTTQTLILTLIIQIISGIVLGGWLAKADVEALATTVVLNQYEIMTEQLDDSVISAFSSWTLEVFRTFLSSS
uniref:hypothetical protein n=1 Tax=Kosakonia oryzae TaxID=497725 RepID=UPI0005EDEFA3